VNGKKEFPRIETQIDPGVYQVLGTKNTEAGIRMRGVTNNTIIHLFSVLRAFVYPPRDNSSKPTFAVANARIVVSIVMK
jgi:hypothetical protein